MSREHASIEAEALLEFPSELAAPSLSRHRSTAAPSLHCQGLNTRIRSAAGKGSGARLLLFASAAVIAIIWVGRQPLSFDDLSARLARSSMSQWPPQVTGLELSGNEQALLAEGTTDELSAEVAVRQLLQQYEEAYRGLSVELAAKVWPSADRVSLAEVLEGVEMQRLSLERCDVDVAESRATAFCRAVLRFMNGSERPGSSSVQQDWIFNMRHERQSWTIDWIGVSQSRASVSSPR
ncbi:MAG: hypothetical protein AB7F99_02845 [Vicinamibacterales bacterium]